MKLRRQGQRQPLLTTARPSPALVEAREAAKPLESCTPYAEAQRLLAIYRAQGPQALSPQQHDDIWDCLLAQPASQELLEALVEEAQAEMHARTPAGA